jgi:AraC-like DNA-binding protein
MDADGNGTLDAAEIKNAAVALRKIDGNRDSKLTEDEVGMKHFGPQETGVAYSSAIAIDFGGQRQYVQFLATTVAGVSATDGKLLWRYDKPANGMKLNISTPIHHEGHIFAASAYGAGGGVARLAKGGNGEFTAEEAWFSKNMENHHGGVILHDGALFGANGGNGGGYLACLDFKTGEVLWNENDSEKRRVTKGSVAFADGRIYCRTEEGPVKQTLRRSLAGKRPTMQEVASELGLSVRTLQRRLSESNVSFQGLLVDVRKELAHHYLQQAVVEFNEVAFLLGSEDANSFFRAFQEWEWHSPSEWRRRNRVLS